MFDTKYLSFVANAQWMPVALILGVAGLYLTALKTSWKKRLLAAGPSLLLLAMAIVSTIMGAMRTGAPNHDGVVDALLLIIIPFVAVSLTVFNIFYIKSKLNLIQVPNWVGGLFSWFIAGMALSHDWL